MFLESLVVFFLDFFFNESLIAFTLSRVLVVFRDGGEARNTTLSPPPTTNTPLHHGKEKKQKSKTDPIPNPLD